MFGMVYGGRYNKWRKKKNYNNNINFAGIWHIRCYIQSYRNVDALHYDGISKSNLIQQPNGAVHKCLKNTIPEP